MSPVASYLVPFYTGTEIRKKQCDGAMNIILSGRFSVLRIPLDKGVSE